MNLCDLFDELIIGIIDKLSDRDKIKFMITCSRFYYFIDKTKYFDIYDYNKISHLTFIEKFRNIKFYAVNDEIPSNTTHLILSNEYIGSLKNPLPNLKYIKLTNYQYLFLSKKILPHIEIDKNYRNPYINLSQREYFDDTLIGLRPDYIFWRYNYNIKKFDNETNKIINNHTNKKINNNKKHQNNQKQIIPKNIKFPKILSKHKH
ncbi:putative F-box protein [Niemeyer virus]|uniref:F-box protein n=1 Tax=Acanthamoeba polyphaga mimivirus Kroon TaxID=3069720 RepID=A0A0G2Y2B6_9VIRU|nr:putative F-box protein [Acanthamoeba polyphaga mimivirus]AKI79900.1 putative F-box protein [Acanthamoeba polyphaga mimivirus Kroon]ALR83733.1 putative F-box protein [Niemeyer virus]